MFYLNIFEMDMIEEDTNQHKNFCKVSLLLYWNERAKTYRQFIFSVFLFPFSFSLSLSLFISLFCLVNFLFLPNWKPKWMCWLPISMEKKNLLLSCCMLAEIFSFIGHIRWLYHFDRMLLVMYLFFPFQTMCINQFSMNICFHICPKLYWPRLIYLFIRKQFS